MQILRETDLRTSCRERTDEVVQRSSAEVEKDLHYTDSSEERVTEHQIFTHRILFSFDQIVVSNLQTRKYGTDE